MEIVLYTSKEDIGHIFKNFDMDKIIWATIEVDCPSPTKFDLSFVNQIKHRWINKGWYTKIVHSPLEKIITIV